MRGECSGESASLRKLFSLFPWLGANPCVLLVSKVSLNDTGVYRRLFKGHRSAKVRLKIAGSQPTSPACDEAITAERSLSLCRS